MFTHKIFQFYPQSENIPTELLTCSCADSDNMPFITSEYGEWLSGHFVSLHQRNRIIFLPVVDLLDRVNTDTLFQFFSHLL